MDKMKGFDGLERQRNRVIKRYANELCLAAAIGTTRTERSP